MKKLALTVLLLLGVICAGQASPFLPVDQAAAVAQKELKDRGLEAQIYVTALTIQKDGLATAERHWYAAWSDAIPGENRKKEVGMRINMDGSTVRVVEGPGSTEALRNPRTRSDRPSILDLKH